MQHCKTDQNKEDVEEDEDEEYGVRRSVKKLDLREPSKGEREEHEKTHLLLRNWCRHCVRGRGKEEACRDAKRDQEVAEVHLDFMFMGDEGDDRTLAVLVVKERSRGMVMSTVAPRKSSGQCLGRRVMAFMRDAGCEVEAVVIKSDNEPALTKVVEEIGRLRAAIGGQGMVVENSLVHSSKSNGFIEGTIQSVQELVRTWLNSLEAKWGVKLDVEHRIWPWLVWVDDVEGRRGSRREDGLREVQREACKASWDGVRRGGLVEKAARRRTTRKTVMHVGGWDLPGCEGDDG